MRSVNVVGAGLFAAALLGVVVAGCEIAIGKDVPAFECVQEAAVCPGNEVCDPSSHQCVPPCTVTGCAGGTQCDPISSTCIPVVPSDDGPAGDDTTSSGGPGDGDAATQPDEAAPPVDTGPGPETGPCRGVGCPCTGPGSCDSGICADQLTVPSGLYAAAGGSFCTKPCCTSANCDAATVCFGTGAAGNFCVNPTWLQRQTALGTGQGGASCSTGRDCRSGLCGGGSSGCTDTCCSTFSAANDCAGGSQCRFGIFAGTASFDKNFVAYCGHGGSRPNGQSCSFNSDCESELCDGVNCADACRNTGECLGSGEACTYVIPNTAPSGTAVAACYSGPPTPGTTPEGGSCSTDGDCQSDLCDANSHACTDVCFADSDCTKSGWRCRPESITLSGGGKVSALLCGT
jgi:hypothetical protein